MSGGILDADESSTVSGALTQSADITIDVATGKTLTYSGAAVNLGAKTLTLIGGGTLSNTNAFVLNNSNSILALSGTVILGLANVTAASNTGKGLAVNASGTISNLKVFADTALNVAAGITLSGETEIVSGTTLTLSSTGTIGSNLNLKGTLLSSATLTVSGLISVGGDSSISIPAAGKTLTYSGGDLNVGAHTLSIGGAGTFSNATNSALVLDDTDSILDLSGTGTISGPVKLESGKLKSSGSSTISGTLTQYGDSTIEIAETKTLTYEGAAIEIGAYALRILGGGTFVNTGSALELNNASSQINFSGVTVEYIRATADSLGLVVDNTSTVTKFTVGHVTPVSISPNQSFNGLIEVYSNSNLQLSNTGTLAANVKISGLGGKLEVQETMTFSGSLLQVALHEGFELIVAAGKSMTYSGSEFEIGNHTFKLSGGGTFNNTNNLILDDPISLLSISESTKISRLQVNDSGTSGGMKITASDDNSTENLVGNLSLSDSFSVSSDVAWAVDNITADTVLTFSSDKNVNFGALTLTGSADFSLGNEDIALNVTSPVTVGNTQKLQNGGGSFNFIGGLSLETGSKLIGQGKQVSGNIVLNGGQIATEQSTVLTDNLTQSADSTIQIDPSKALTYQGAPFEIGSSKLKIHGGGNLINSTASTLSLNNSDSHLVLDNVTVSYVSSSEASNSSKGLEVTADSLLTNLSLSEKIRLSIANDKNFSITESLTVPTQGMDLAGAGTLDLTDNLTLNGNVTLASGSLTIDARELQLNLGGDLNLVGGVLLTDNTTNLHLLANSIVTTNSEQTVGKVTILESQAPMLTLGNTTKLEIVKIVSIASSCPMSLPIKPKAQVKLEGGIQVETGGTLCIDGWLKGDIVLNGGTLQVDDDTTIDSSSRISLLSSSILKIVTGKTLAYSGSAISVGTSTLTLNGGGSFVSGGLTLNDADSKLLLNSITLDSAITSADSLGLDVDNNSTITALSVGHITPVSIAAGKSLSGAVTVTAGSLKLNETGTLASTIAMSGGTLDADETSIVSGALSHIADITDRCCHQQDAHLFRCSYQPWSKYNHS